MEWLKATRGGILRLLVLSGLATTAACTMPGDGVTTVSPERESNASASLISAGCRRVTTEGDGVVLLRSPEDGVDRLDCAALRRPTIHSTIRNARMNDVRPPAVASLQQEYYNVRVYYHCEYTTVWEYNPGYGDYVVVSQEGWCKTWVVYLGGDEPTGSWSGGGGGGPLPDEIPAVPPRVEDDSLTVETMNWVEAARCLLHPVQCASYVHFSNLALEWARDRAGSAGATNNQYDAQRHAFWSAQLASAYGSAVAQAWTDAHEEGLPPSEMYATCMDQTNNAIGREIGEANRYATASTLQALVLARANDLQNSTVNAC